MGIKISEFLGSTSAQSSSYLTIVQGSVNYKISVADFMSSVGVSGSIVQDGAVTGTPVLDVAGTVNNIRNLEDGDGILTAVSAENGITISHNFDADATGLPLLLNSATASPDIASLVAGEGVSLTATANSIEIEFTGIPTDVVVINALADFPAPVSGVITLLADTGYQISGTVELGVNRIVGSGGTVIFGTDASVTNLTYTGSGVMFTSAVGNFKLRDLTVDCPNGQLIASSSSVDGLLQFVNITVDNCDTVGTATNLLATQFESVGFSNVATGGLVFSGTHGAFAMVRSLVTINGGTMFDLGTSSFLAGWSAETSFSTLGAGTTFLSGQVGSGNMAIGALGSLFNTRFSGAGAPLNNISVDDKRWQFFGNDEIPDTRPDALLSHQGSLTVAIATVNTPVKVTGTPAWVVERVSQITADTTGTATFNGVKDATLPITATIAAEPASGTNKDYTFYIAINGAVVANSGAKTTISAGGPKNTMVAWQEALEDGDTVELWAENNTDAIDVVVNSAILRIN